MINEEVFKGVIKTLCDAYEKDITEERVAIYYDALKNDFTDNDLTNALPKILQKSRFFPTIADIVNGVQEYYDTYEPPFFDLRKEMNLK